MADFKIKKLNTIIVQVKDLEKSIHFYESVMGLNRSFVHKNMAFFQVGSGNGEVTVLLHTVDAPEPSDKGMVIELLVDDVDKAVSSIKSAGGEIAQEPINQDWGVREAVVTDPDGYKIWLAQGLT
jgi:predicted enzyme related to lactoylglutathione lyase